MAKILKPVLPREENAFYTTKNHFYNLFKPIQSTGSKQSDLTAYLFTPVIDVVLLPFYLLDAAIELCNTVVSLAYAFETWTHNQQSSRNVLDSATKSEFNTTGTHFVNAVSLVLAALINPLLSILAWLTRPIASVVQAISDGIEHSSQASYRVRLG